MCCPGSTALDRGNPWNGTVLQGWTVSKPLTLPSSGAVLVPYTKVGTYVQSHERQWVVRSENLLTEADAAKVEWTTWPSGDGGPSLGCAAADGSDDAEEGGLLSLGGTVVTWVFRSSGGRVNECVSFDDGRTWTPRLSYYAGLPSESESESESESGGAPPSASAPLRPLKNPRGPLTARKLANGDFLLLYFNNGWKDYSPGSNNTRNPYFLTLGRQVGDAIRWAQPEVALYGRGWVDDLPTPVYDLAYPDIVEDGGRVVVFEAHELYGGNCTDPTFEALGGCGVSTHVVSPALLDGLRSQFDVVAPPAPTDNVLLDISPPAGGPNTVPAPAFPSLNAAPGGLAVDVWLADDPPRPRTLLDCRDAAGKGLLLDMPRPGVVALHLNDVQASYDVANSSHVAVVVDGGPQLVSWVVDGNFGDGGDHDVLGYSFFRHLGDVNAKATCTVGDVARLRVYGRYLRTSELVAAFRAGPGVVRA